MNRDDLPMNTPYVGFSNTTLASCPSAKAGDKIDCPTCGMQHELQDSDPPMMLFYKCGEQSYMAGINGKLTMGVPADVRGEVSSDPTAVTDDEIKANPGKIVELLPCPFCAGAPRVLQKPQGFGIGCSNPRCQIRVASFHENLETATQMWNTRHGRGCRTQRVRVEPSE